MLLVAFAGKTAEYEYNGGLQVFFRFIGALQVTHKMNFIVSFSSQTFTAICPLEETRGSNLQAR